MKKESFLDFFIESWRLSFSHISLLLFGLFAALPLSLQWIILPSATGMTKGDQVSIEQFVEGHPGTVMLFIVSALFFSLLGKSGLVILLHHHTREAPLKKLPSLSAFFRAFKRAFLLDGAIVLFLTGLTFILVSPILISLAFLSRVPDALNTLFLSAFFLMLVVMFFVREFSFFYFLLSPLGLRSAIEAATALFFKNRSLSLLFGIFFLLIWGIFTFFAIIVMLDIVVLFQKFLPQIPEKALLVAVSLLFFSWYKVFLQTLWFIFFRHLARPQDSVPQEDAPQILKEKVEISGV